MRRLWAIATLALGAFAMSRAPAGLLSYGHDLDEYTIPGERLLHRVPGDMDENGRMPLSSVTAAVLSNHAGRRAWRAEQTAARADAFGLMLACGVLLGPYPRALAAPAVLLASVPFSGIGCWHGRFGYAQSGCTLLVLLVAGLAAWRARAPSQRLDAALGAAIGATLLYRSVLLFLPPSLLAWDWLERRRRPAAGALLGIGLLPYLFLAPWVGMNWARHGRFIAIESGPVNSIVAESALGIARRGSDRRDLAAVPVNVFSSRADDGRAVLAWAAAQTLNHPGRYLSGLAGRLRYLFSLNQLLWLLALAGTALRRRDPAYRALAVLAAYLLAAIAALAVRPEYAEPLWPLLSLLGAGAVLPRASEGEARAVRAAKTALGAALAAVLLACACVCGVVAAYAVLPGSLIEEAARRNPDDPWLLAQLAQRHLAASRADLAVQELEKSLALRPGHPRRETLLAWARLWSGNSAAFRRWREEAALNPAEPEPFLLAAIGEQRLGLSTTARADLASGLATLGCGGAAARGCPDSAVDGLIDFGRIWLAPWPGAPALFLRGCLKAGSWRADARKRLALSYARLGKSAPGAASMEDLRQEALRHQDLGQQAAALPVFEELARRAPEDPELTSDEGVSLFLNGRTRDAERALRRAITLDPRALSAYLSLGAVLTAEGRADQAASVYDAALSQAPRQGDSRLRALIARERGRLDRSALKNRQILRTDPPT